MHRTLQLNPSRSILQILHLPEDLFCPSGARKFFLLDSNHQKRCSLTAAIVWGLRPFNRLRRLNKVGQSPRIPLEKKGWRVPDRHLSSSKEFTERKQPHNMRRFSHLTVSADRKNRQRHTTSCLAIASRSPGAHNNRKEKKASEGWVCLVLYGLHDFVQGDLS